MSAFAATKSSMARPLASRKVVISMAWDMSVSFSGTADQMT
jgi:hypothetical protein